MTKYQRHKIKYCPICGYVDLTGKENECIHCNISLESTDEYFDEICLQLENTTKKDVEEYIRQLYVYLDNRFDEEIMSHREIDENISEQIDYYENLIFDDTDKDACKCPTCQSTNIKRVSGTSKVVSVAMFGLLSQKVKRTFHCNNCGYEW